MAIVKTNSAHYSNIAAKIREKTGEATKYEPSQMADGIEAVYEAGKGASKAVVEKDVNFYDYDGTLLYSYTLDEVQSLTELPPLPTRDGLICQEWNWTLDGLKALGRPMTVGATYITDDGATRLHLDIPKGFSGDVPIYFYQTVSNGVTVDKGDGTTVTVGGANSYVSVNIHVNTEGERVVRLIVADGCTMSLGDGTNGVLGSSAGTNRHIVNLLAKVCFGKYVSSIGENAFNGYMALREVSLSSNARLSEGCFYNTKSLRFLVTPKGNTDTPFSSLRGSGLCGISISPSLTRIRESSLRLTWLRKLDVPDNVGFDWDSLREIESLTKINVGGGWWFGDYTFRYCSSLKELDFGEGQPNVTGVCQGCTSLTRVGFPSVLKSIGNNTFYQCLGMRKYDFTKLNAVPTLANVSAFTDIPAECVIVVPDNLLAEWKAATNWSTYASYIKGASEV